uniref:pyridoxal 5'-phosphate synthase glutaminase subunit PdxT n=1 Tax=Aquiluna sp. TaxID=2053504 RepID=UPI004047D476
MLIGVLALQGDVREHENLLHDLGVQTKSVRRPVDLEGIDGLIIPGGESTAISKLINLFDLMQPLRDFVTHKPVLGTCAGLILLSDEVEGRLEDQELIGGLKIKASRNAYGSQTESFEAEVDYEGASERVAFIRAPKILDARETEVLATYNGEPVAVKQGNIMAAAYHPEITGSRHLHSLFISEIESRQ